MRNFKFTAVAAIVLLLLSFMFSPPNTEAATTSSMENKTVLVIAGSPSATVISRLVRASESRSITIVSAPDAPDALFAKEFAPDISLAVESLPPVIPAREIPRQEPSYISRNRQQTIKPPESRVNRTKPDIVRLC